MAADVAGNENDTDHEALKLRIIRVTRRILIVT
jgi:hypothetical protein